MEPVAPGGEKSAFSKNCSDIDVDMSVQHVEVDLTKVA